MRLTLIIHFKHKGLKEFFLTGRSRRVNSAYLRKIARILLSLNNAKTIRDLDLPGFRTHRLKGNEAEIYSVWVSENWRITFRFENGEVSQLDLRDHH